MRSHAIFVAARVAALHANMLNLKGGGNLTRSQLVLERIVKAISNLKYQRNFTE